VSNGERGVRDVGWDTVENPVLDGRGEGGGGVAVDRDCSVDGLKGGAMEVEFSVEEKVGVGGEQGWDEVGEDGGIPVMFVAGLEGAIEEEGTDAVEFGLDIERVGEFVGVVFPTMGEHGFHSRESGQAVRISSAILDS